VLEIPIWWTKNLMESSYKMNLKDFFTNWVTVALKNLKIDPSKHGIITEFNTFRPIPPKAKKPSV
jgi:hypothetical protein